MRGGAERVNLVMIVFWVAGIASGGGVQAANEKIVLSGSSTLAPLILEIGKAFEARNPGVRVDVQTGGSSRGVADARQGLANIGMVSRILKDDEKDLTAFTIARDGISIIVHKKNPISKLDQAQVVGIYTGQIKNWKEVGGVDTSIIVVNKAEGHSTLELFLAFFKLRNTDVKASVVIGDNEHGIKTVAGNPNAIGYVSIGTAEYDASIGVPIKLLPVDGIEASTVNITNGKFPLSRPLNLVTQAELSETEKKFIEFARSHEVSAIVWQQYFVPIAQ